MSTPEVLETSPEAVAVHKVIDIASGQSLTPEQLQASQRAYEAFHDATDEAVHISLFGDDVQTALENPETTLVQYEDEAGQRVFMPLLVPAGALEWKNPGIVSDAPDTTFLVYTHPQIPDDEQSQKQIQDALQAKLDEGAQILVDQYAGRTGVEADFPDGYVLEHIGGKEGEYGKTDLYVGELAVGGIHEPIAAPTLMETYQEAVASGAIEAQPENGVSLAETITGDEAERIWQLYKKPFDDLSATHPEHAGFSKEELIEILGDPDVIKAVNRVDGTISTLCLLLNKFEHEPWFNVGYFKKNFPKFFETDNIFMFPGIVTDEEMRGEGYALDVIDLVTKLLARRKSGATIVFECTEESTKYIPTGVVMPAVENSGVARISGITDPKDSSKSAPRSTIEYKVLKKAA